MGGSDYIWNRILGSTELSEESIIKRPIIEIAGYKRILIENHCGVAAYSTERIIVKMGYGHVHFCGCHLTIMQMSREQLVICGTLNCVSIQRRD